MTAFALSSFAARFLALVEPSCLPHLFRGTATVELSAEVEDLATVTAELSAEDSVALETEEVSMETDVGKPIATAAESGLASCAAEIAFDASFAAFLSNFLTSFLTSSFVI